MHQVVSRFLIATEGLDRLWMEWGLLKEKTFASALKRLTEMQAVFKQRKIQVALLRLQKLADNVKWLTQHYDETFRKFRNEDHWNTELVDTVKALLKDRELQKRLNIDTHIDVEWVVEGVQTYFDDVTAKDPSVDDFLDIVNVLGKYSEGEESKDRAETALAKLSRLDFTRQTEAFRAALAVCPELQPNVLLKGEGSYDYFQTWVGMLEAAMRGEPEDLQPLLEDAENIIPIWFGGYEGVTDNLDLSFLDGKRSALYWHTVELERFTSLLENAASVRLDNPVRSKSNTH